MSGLDDQGRENYFMDVDRMVNEGLAGGQTSEPGGYIGETTTGTMNHPESAFDDKAEENDVLKRINESYEQPGYSRFNKGDEE